MVSTNQSYSFGVFDLQTEEEFEGFNRMVSAINEISNEDIASFLDLSAWNKSSFTGSEEFEEIVELAVDVSADGDGSGDGLNIGLLHEYLFGFFADNPELAFVEDFGVPELGNAFVDVHKSSKILKFLYVYNYR